MNPKEFMKRWIEGIKNITPAQQLHAEMIGLRGNIVGMIFALVFLLLNGMWYFTIFLVFTTFLQVVALIGVKQKYDTVVRIMQPLEEEDHKKKSEELLRKLGGIRK